MFCWTSSPHNSPTITSRQGPTRASLTLTRLLKAFKELVANDYPMAEALYAGGVFAVRLASRTELKIIS